MKRISALGIAALVAGVVVAGPALAAESMMSGGMMAGHGMMMKPGETVMVMPNGETMMVPAMKGDMDAGMMKMAKPLDHCVMVMMGTDHKMYMMDDMKMADGKMACETMSMMKK